MGKKGVLRNTATTSPSSEPSSTVKKASSIVVPTPCMNTLNFVVRISHIFGKLIIARDSSPVSE